MHVPTEFAVSSNGDRWFLERNGATGEDLVLHRGNPSSGGHETRLSVDAFLAQRPWNPQQDALRTMLATLNAPHLNAETSTSSGAAVSDPRDATSGPSEGG